MWYVYYGCHTLPIDNFHHWLLVTKMTKMTKIFLPCEIYTLLYSIIGICIYLLRNIYPTYTVYWRNIHPPIQYIGICIYLPYEIYTLLYRNMYIHPPIQYIGICIYLPYEICTLLYSILAYVYTYLTKYTPSYTVYWHMYIPTLRNIHPPIQYIGICIYLPYEIYTLLYSILAYVYTYLTKYTPSYTVYWHMYIPTLRNIYPPIQYIGICIYLPYEIYTLLYSILAYVYTYLQPTTRYSCGSDWLSPSAPWARDTGHTWPRYWPAATERYRYCWWPCLCGYAAPWSADTADRWASLACPCKYQ